MKRAVEAQRRRFYKKSLFVALPVHRGLLAHPTAHRTRRGHEWGAPCHYFLVGCPWVPRLKYKTGCRSPKTTIVQETCFLGIALFPMVQTPGALTLTDLFTPGFSCVYSPWPLVPRFHLQKSERPPRPEDKEQANKQTRQQCTLKGPKL